MSPPSHPSREDSAGSPAETPDNRHSYSAVQEKNDVESPKQTQQERDREADREETPSKRSNWKKYWWLIPVLGVVLAIGGVAVMRWRENASEEATTTQIAPLSVRTTTARMQPLREWVSSLGTVRAREFQHLTFEVEGDVTYLADRNGRRLREGDRVQQGELLARVDDRELVADVKQAQAAVAEARQQRAAAAADIAQAQAQVSRARSQVQEAQAGVAKAQTSRNLAQTELQRYRQLFNQGAVAASEYDVRVSDVDDAQADLQAAQAQVTTAQNQVNAAQAQVRAAQEQRDAAQARVETAQAQLAQAKVALEGASIYAPFDGIIAYLNITEGEYFSPQLVTTQLAGDYQGILERVPMVIIDPSQYEVIVDLAAPNGEGVRPGQTAFVASKTDVKEASASTTYQDRLEQSARARGEVFAVNPAISPGGRAIEARIRLNPNTTTNVQHGERVNAWIAVEEQENALVVPLNAVVQRDRQSYVFVVNEEKEVVEQRPVELGIKGITHQEILSGVKPNELVVTEGQNRLVEGAPVQVVERR
jgi:RND family efflux transporter MFP subunit